jgi:hypothetical protein
MSKPPLLSDDILDLSPRPPKRSVLAKLAAILAVIFIGFGLCTANAMREGTAANVGAISGSIALICFVALIVVGLIAIFRSRT